MCRSRRELSNEYLLDEIGVDTAENELLEVLFNIIQYYSFVSLAVTFETKKGVVALSTERRKASRRIRRNYEKTDLAAVVTGEGPNLNRTALVPAN